MTDNDALQAIVAAIRYGEDIAIASQYGTGRSDFTHGYSILHPGAGISVTISTEAADLLKQAYKIYFNMPPDETRDYGRSLCDMTTFNT